MRKFFSDMGAASAKKRKEEMGTIAYKKMMSEMGKLGGWPKGRPRKKKKNEQAS